MSHFYIASPYTHDEETMREHRYQEAMRFVAWVLENQGPIPLPFSPILYCHEMAKRFKLPTDFLFWRVFNRTMIRTATHVTILRLPGWDQSKGVLDEIAFAEHMSIPHFWADLDGDGAYILKLA